MNFGINVRVASIAPLWLTGILFTSAACLGFGGVGVGGISVNVGAGGLGIGGAAVGGGDAIGGPGGGAIGSDATGVSAGTDAGVMAGTPDGVTAKSVAQAAAAQRAALKERASLQVGFGPRQPDRGMGYALSYARTTAAAASAVSSADKAVKTAVSAFPALPDVTAEAESAAASAGLLQTASDRILSDPPTEPSRQARPAANRRSLGTRDTTTMAHGVQALRKAGTPRLMPRNAAAAALHFIARHAASDPRSTTVVFDPPDPSYAMPMIADSASREATLDGPAEHGWIVTGDFPDVQTSSLAMGLATVLVMVLSATSAYGFVRLTSSKCPQCAALIQRQSLGCHNCGARFRPSGRAEWRLSS